MGAVALLCVKLPRIVAGGFDRTQSCEAGSNSTPHSEHFTRIEINPLSVSPASRKTPASAMRTNSPLDPWILRPSLDHLRIVQVCVIDSIEREFLSGR